MSRQDNLSRLSQQQNPQQLQSEKQTNKQFYFMPQQDERNIKNAQFSNYLENMSTDKYDINNNNNTNTKNINNNHNKPFIINTNINNFSVQISSDLNTQFQVNNSNNQKENSFSFDSNQQPSQIKKENIRSSNKNLIIDEDELNSSTQQHKYISIEEKQQRINALQNIANQKKDIQKINSSFNSSNSNNINNQLNNMNDIKNSNQYRRNKYGEVRYKTPLQPVRALQEGKSSQNVISIDNPQIIINSNEILQNKNQFNQQIQFSQDLQKQLEEEITNVEEMHYYLVNFQQKSKEWLKQIESEFN